MIHWYQFFVSNFVVGWTHETKNHHLHRRTTTTANMTNIGMLTPDRFHMERSRILVVFFEIYSSWNDCLGHSLFDFPRRLFLNPFDIDDDDTATKKTLLSNRIGSFDEDAPSSAKKKSKAWSVRARRDEPNLLRGDRYFDSNEDFCSFNIIRL